MYIFWRDHLGFGPFGRKMSPVSESSTAGELQEATPAMDELAAAAAVPATSAFSDSKEEMDVEQCLIGTVRAEAEVAAMAACGQSSEQQRAQLSWRPSELGSSCGGDRESTLQTPTEGGTQSSQPGNLWLLPTGMLRGWSS